MCQDIRLGRGKSDVLVVEREMLRGISSDVVAMGATLLEVARVTSWRWQERPLGCGKSDVKRYHLRRGCYGSNTPRRCNSDCVEGI
jgi:hypothetical protein